MKSNNDFGRYLKVMDVDVLFESKPMILFDVNVSFAGMQEASVDLLRESNITTLMVESVLTKLMYNLSRSEYVVLSKLFINEMKLSTPGLSVFEVAGIAEPKMDGIRSHIVSGNPFRLSVKNIDIDTNRCPLIETFEIKAERIASEVPTHSFISFYEATNYFLKESE